VKPHAGLLAAALLALVALVAYAEGRPLAAPVAVFAAALVVPTLAAVAWLAAAGALPAWYEIVAGYLVPLYSRLGGPERWTFYRWHVWMPIAAGVALALGSADAAWIAARERRVQALVADLDGRIAPEDFVQVLDTTEAGIHALLRLHAVQPTRFIYDFHFYHDTQTRTVQRLREEFLAGFDAH